MNEVTAGRQLEDIPDLIHRIQSLLPVKEAARTSVLSKSWLHAWSTIPTLRFGEALLSVSEEQERDLLKPVFNRTLRRYLDNNLPINSIDHEIWIDNQETSSSLAENWIKSVAMISCLKQLSLGISVMDKSFRLPDEIYSGKNLTKIKISAWTWDRGSSVWMTSCPVINCMFLTELCLDRLRISEEVLDAIFSTCKLLVTVHLFYCEGEFKTIKIKNLECLNKLSIFTREKNTSCTVLEINNVPNLCSCDLRLKPELRRLMQELPEVNPLPFSGGHSLSLGSNVTELSLHGLIIDDACMDVIKSSLPFLKILYLNIEFWRLTTFKITCDSMERLYLMSCPQRVTSVKVDAPKLTFFYIRLRGMTTIPSLKFSTRPKQIKVESYLLENPVGASFFVNLWEALKLSSECYIEITAEKNTVVQPPFDVDILNLRERVPFPAKNVQELSFQTIDDDSQQEYSPFFDALFSICHPKKVVAMRDMYMEEDYNIIVSPFLNMMVHEIMEKNTRKVSEFLHWPFFLKRFEILPENEDPLDTVFELNWH